MVKKVSIVGLGKLGLPLAVCLAYRGLHVLGVDIDEEKIEQLSAGQTDSQEPGLQEYLNNCIERLEFTTDIGRAIEETALTFVLVGTPSDKEGRFSNQYVVYALHELAKALKKSDKTYHTFIVGSTVMPGAAADYLIPVIEDACGAAEFGYAYVPELVALGDCINGFLNPDFVVIGADDQRSEDIAAWVYGKLAPEAPKLTLSIAEAEIFKVALNFILTMKISFANTLAGICERFKGANVDNISWAIGHDSRISPKFLKGGLAFGGFCFPRDVEAYEVLEREIRLFRDRYLSSAVWDTNAAMDDRLLDKVLEMAYKLPSPSVSILGQAFKPGTAETEASPAVFLSERLQNSGVSVVVHDPMAARAKTMSEVAGASPIVVVATAWPEYGYLKPQDFQPGAIVLDCWRCLSHEVKTSDRIKYHAIGVGN
jgi:UDPglucose 6-dehydrogenase